MLAAAGGVLIGAAYALNQVESSPRRDSMLCEHPIPVTTGSPAFLSMAVGGLRVSDTHFPSDLRLPTHGHDSTSFGVVLEGALDVTLANTVHDCRTGTIESKPAGEPHANRFGRRGARVLVMEPDGALGRLPHEVGRALDRPCCFADAGALGLARRMACELRAGDSAAGLALEGLALELLACFARRSEDRRSIARPPAWLTRAREILHGSFRSPPPVASIARSVGVHPAYLARRFRRHYGTTMGGYVRVLRLELAARRLTTEDTAIATIALEAGFTDQSSFTRAFRDWAGTTPGRWRSRVT